MISNYSDHSANERTFLAWVRTAVAVVGFGLAAGRMQSTPAPAWSEALMLAAGAVVVLVAYLRMRNIRKRINAKEASDEEGVPSDTLVLVLLAALFALLTTFAMHAG